MIAPRQLPASFSQWNHEWGAPGGRTFPAAGRLRYQRWALQYRGPFAHQSNSLTRRFEYPWAYDAVASRGPALDIVEFGGGLSGMQFVLAREGHHVTNIDPGARPGAEWGFTQDAHTYLCKIFGAGVSLVPDSLDHADLPDHSADVVMSISVLEHLSSPALEQTAAHIRRVLRASGVAIFTIDLFLDLYPFSSQTDGQWGRNVNVREFLETAGLELISGRTSELFGFPDFDARSIGSRRHSYLVSDVGSTAQCLIARLHEA